MKASKKYLASLFSVLAFAGVANAFDENGLRPISPLKEAKQNDQGLELLCEDNSRIQIKFLKDDLVHVNASIAGQSVQRKKSWAVAKTDWAKLKTEFVEEKQSLRFRSETLEVSIQKNPFIIQFRERKTGKVWLSDERPISRDPLNGRVASFKKLGLDEHFYGLGERAAGLDRRRGQFTLWNSDTPGYVEGTDPLYQSIPFYIGMEHGQAYGLFYDNSFRSSFDFGRTGQDYAGFCAEGGEIDYYFFAGPSMRTIVERYTELTGRISMPPLWSLGNQQCRYSYYPDTMVESIAAEYRKRDLPLDAMYLDIHYMDGYRSFTWDKQRFSDPKGMISRLGEKGVKVVTIVDPGIKFQPHKPSEPGYFVYDEGVQNDYFLRRQNGNQYIAEVWPGKSVFVDYTKPEASAWWGGLHKDFIETGVAGFWNDMNEPSDFIDKSGATQTDVVFDDEGRRSSYLENRNLFGMLMSKATFEGLKKIQPDTRPFVITRAGYAGVQRYAVTWTGDNNATWESLALSIPMFASMGLSGQAFVGSDVPGFMGKADGELLARSYQVAFLVPLCRNHGTIDGYDHEPWRFGAHYEGIVRKYLKTRYSLMPFIYSTMEKAYRTGHPFFQPLVLNYQDDESVANMDDQFMIGDTLMAAPILHPRMRARDVYFPKGVWYNFWTGEKRNEQGVFEVAAPLDHLPLYVRGGSIVPSTDSMQSTSEKPWSPLRFSIYPDEQGAASGELYEDDGKSTAFETGLYRRTKVRCEKHEDRTKITIEKPEGRFQPSSRNMEVILNDLSKVQELSLDGVALSLQAANSSSQGYFVKANTVVIRLHDDSKSHELILK